MNDKRQTEPGDSRAAQAADKQGEALRRKQKDDIEAIFTALQEAEIKMPRSRAVPHPYLALRETQGAQAFDPTTDQTQRARGQAQGEWPKWRERPQPDRLFVLREQRPYRDALLRLLRFDLAAWLNLKRATPNLKWGTY